MEHVSLLWTGGWDSTFRLMMLLLVHTQVVQPYYLIGETRRSFPMEIMTMGHIRREVARRWPEARPLLRPTIHVARTDLRPDAEITELYNRVNEQSRLGGQYDWLARLAREWDLDDLEIGIHASDRASVFCLTNAYSVSGPTGCAYRLREHVGVLDLRLFKRFVFPLLHLRKVQMQAIAHEHGFADVLEMTWFCHEPRTNGRPCGVCNPCLHTRMDGLGRRVPAPPLLYSLRRWAAPALPAAIKRPLKRLLGWQ